MTAPDKPLIPADPAVHSDNEKSAVPVRPDADRQDAPNDPPGTQGEEPPVG